MVLMRSQIDSIPKGAVVFISVPPKTVNAVYGGLMSARAKASGAAGTIVDGRVRDLQEHRDLVYPVRQLFESRLHYSMGKSKLIYVGLGLRQRNRHDGTF